MDKNYAKEILEQTKQNYNLISRHFSSTRQFVSKDLAPLVDYTASGDKVLDAGCGNGRLYNLFKEKNADYFGIDNSEQLIKIAKEKYPKASFQIADVLKIPFPDNFFDKVYCVAVLHHIPSEQLRMEALKELKRVLKSNGLLILTVWNLWKRRTFWRKDIFVPWKNQKGEILAQRYIHAFTKTDLKNLAEKAGFKIKEIGITFRSELKDNNIYLIASN